MKVSLKNQAIILLSIILLTIGSCRKKDTPPTPVDPIPTDDARMMQDFMESNARKAELFTFDPTVRSTLTTEYGSVVTIPANRLAHLDGTLYTGEVKLKVTEIHSIGDMIFEGISTVNDGDEILESAGMFKLDVRDTNNIPLMIDTVTDTTVIAITVNTNNVNRKAQVWDGIESESVIVTGYDYQNKATSVVNPYLQFTPLIWSDPRASGLQINSTSYNLMIRDFNKWYNIDWLYHLSGPKTTFFAYVDTFNDSTMYFPQTMRPTAVHFIPNDGVSAVALSMPILNSPREYRGLHTQQNLMPIGMQGKFMAFTALGGKFYAQVIDNTEISAPDAGKDYSYMNFHLQEISEANLKQLINSL